MVFSILFSEKMVKNKKTKQHPKKEKKKNPPIKTKTGEYEQHYLTHQQHPGS